MTTRRRVLSAPEGFSPGVGFYFSGMQEVREQVRKAVEDLTVEQVSHQAIPGAHSIGALVLHIGEAEWWWMQCVVSGHKLTEEDRRAPFWDVLEEPEAFASKAYNAEFCLKEIDKIRDQTGELLAAFSDKDLEPINSYDRDGEIHEHNLRWILHHLIDHEAQHKGQILMLKRLMAS